MTPQTLNNPSAGSGLIIKHCNACGRCRPVTDVRDRYFICDECRSTQAGMAETMETLPAEFKRVLGAYELRYGCCNCAGLGVRSKGKGASAKLMLCECALRSAFEGLLNAYHAAVCSPGRIGEVSVRHSRSGLSFYRKNQEFVADVEIMARRITKFLDSAYADTFPHHTLIWREFFQSGYDWKFCARAAGLPLDGNGKFRFFDGVNRVKEYMAREACSLKPYALFPVAGY